MFQPIKLRAAEIPVVPYEKTAVYRPSDEVIEQTTVEYERTHPKPIKSPKKTTANYCSCVAGVNAHFGTHFKTLDGFARSIPTNSQIPASSGFVITRESWQGHIAHYYLLGDQIIIDWEANYVSCKVSSGRPLSNSLVKGFINP